MADGSGGFIVKDGGGFTLGGASDNIGLFGATPVAKRSAYTQTYSTAARTVSAATAVALTAASGTSDGTVADVGGAFSQTTLNNNFQDLATAVNALIADVLAIRKVQNAIIDDLQALGIAS